MLDPSSTSAAHLLRVGQVLLSSGQSLCHLLEALPMALMVHRADGKVLHCNQAAIALLGEAVLAQLPEATVETLAATLQLYDRDTGSLYPTQQLPVVQALEGHWVQANDLELRQGDRSRMLTAWAAPLYDSARTLSYVMVLLQEGPPIEPQQRPVDCCVAAIPAALYSLVRTADHTWRLDYANPALESLYEAPLDAIVAAPQAFILGQMHREDRPGYGAAIASSAETLSPLCYEWRSLAPSGQERWLQMQAHPDRRPDGAVCWHGVLLDISDRKAAEQALQQQHAQHQQLLQAMPDVMFWVSRWGTWLGHVRNPALQTLLPETKDPMGQLLWQFLPPAMADRYWELMQQALAQGEIQRVEQHRSLPDGRRLYEEVRVVPNGPDAVLFMLRDISDRKRAELALQQSETETQAILAAIPDLLFRIRRDGTYLTYLRGGAAQDLIASEDNPVGHNIRDYTLTDGLKQHIEQQLQAIQHTLETGKMQVYEQVVWVEQERRYEEVRMVPSGVDEVLVMIRDVSDRKRAELALQQSEAQNRAILTAIPDLMLRLRRDGTILAYLKSGGFRDFMPTDCSPVGSNLACWSSSPDLRRHIHRKLQAVRQALETRAMQHYEQVTLWEDELRHEEVRVVPSGPDEALVIVRDVSDRKRIEAELRLANERLERLSFTDSLTGVANRRRLDEHLKVEWRRAMREQHPLALILFDLDQFKRYNDTHGHQQGDACLIQVAQAAQASANRATDLIARYGGEEFALILTNTGLQAAWTVAEQLRQRILALQIPHQSSDISAVVTASFGVSAMIPPRDSQPNLIIRQADRGLYAAKQAGRNTCCCYPVPSAEGP